MRLASDIRVSSPARSPLSAAATRRLAGRVLAAERRDVALSITFVSAPAIRALNRTHLGHDRATDVIAFPLGDAGDIYIAPAVAARNATEAGVRVTDELRRLVVHGVLHVLGYDHPDGEARMRSAMWRRQERYLRRFTA